ncbi:MAG: hypothetical protein ACRDDZ_12995 [Marinifilaceae bacterium]
MKKSLVIKSCMLILVLSFTSELAIAQKWKLGRNLRNSRYDYTIRNINHPIIVEKYQVVNRNSFNSKDRLALIEIYLKNNKYISSKKYARMTGLSKQVAELELEHFSEDLENRIKVIRSGKSKLYTKS